MFRARFRARTRGSRESLTRLAQGLELLVCRAYPEASENMIAVLLRDQFVNAETVPGRTRSRPGGSVWERSPPALHHPQEAFGGTATPAGSRVTVRNIAGRVRVAVSPAMLVEDNTSTKPAAGIAAKVTGHDSAPASQRTTANR